MLTNERTPPANLDAEKALIGSALICPRYVRDMADAVAADDMYLPGHRDVWGAIVRMDAAGEVVDPIPLLDELRRAGALPRLEGGEAYVIACMSDTPTAENWQHYARIVRAKANARRLILACSEATSRLYGDADTQDVAETLAYDVSRVVTGSADELTTLGSYWPALLEDIEARAKSCVDGRTHGVRFGVEALDLNLLGLRPGEVLFLGGRPGSGKSALAHQAGEILVLEDGGTTLEFSLELPGIQVAERTAIRETRINSSLMRRGQITLDDMKALHKAGAKLSGKPFYVESKSFDWRRIQARARAWRAKHPDLRGLMIFDFLQLIRGDEKNRAREVGKIAYGAKELSKELGVASIVVSSLNNEGAKDGKAPSLMDIKESGDASYAGDQVLMLHVANPVDVSDGRAQPVDGILVKYRTGAQKTVSLDFMGRHYRFTDPAPDLGPSEYR